MKGKCILVLIFILLFAGCSVKKRIFVITSNGTLLLPFEAAEFLGYFEKVGVELEEESAGSPQDLLRFLNFSKYSLAVADEALARKVQKGSERWLGLCEVAEDRKGRRYVLLVKEGLLRNKEVLIKVVKGWNLGVESLQDPALLVALTGKEVLGGLKFRKCAGKYEAR